MFRFSSAEYRYLSKKSLEDLWGTSAVLTRAKLVCGVRAIFFCAEARIPSKTLGSAGGEPATPIGICAEASRIEATADGASGREFDAPLEDSCWQNAPQAANRTKPATRIGTVPAIAPPTTNLDGSTPPATRLSRTLIQARSLGDETKGMVVS